MSWVTSKCIILSGAIYFKIVYNVKKIADRRKFMDWSLDGKVYKNTDMAPVGCNDCAGCSSCCREMGDTVIQDPFDMWLFASNMRVAGGMPISFEILISEDGPWELSVQDGLILPNIKMVEDGRCPFLGENGRCSIHKIRSGLCRLFPLSRGYDDEGRVIYYVLNSEIGCEKLKGPGEEVLIRDWLEYPNIQQYEEYISVWHKLKKDIKAKLLECDGAQSGTLQAKFLDTFYSRSYEKDFFADFYGRVEFFRNNILK